MIKLIKAELKKLFHKKSFYIVTMLFVLFSVLINVIYKEMALDYENQVDIQEYKERNASLNLNNEEELQEYIYNLTLIETEELKSQCEDSNCKYMIEQFLFPLIEKSYQEKYFNKDDEEYQKSRNEINDYLDKIKLNDWKYFTNLKIEEINYYLTNSTDDITKTRYQEILKLEQYRLEHNIDYGDSYLNKAILSLEENLFEFYNLKNRSNLTEEEQDRLAYLEENYLTNHYVLDHQKDVNNHTNLQSVLKNFFSEFGLFILIYIVMISGSIVSEEFNKGTIKYLLTKPYKRSTILTSKILTVLLLIPIIVFMMVFIEIVVGGIILGFSSLSIPVLIYQAAAHSLVETSILIYFVQMFLANLPIYIILSVLCFMLSTITTSTSAAITITFLFYLVSNVIANLAIYYPIKIFKAFIALHWDFSYLIHFNSHPYHMETWLSLVVVLLYISVMLCISFCYFNKKDVKNI